MSLTLIPATPRRLKKALSLGITPRGIMHMLRITFVSGPWLLLTSPLSIKNAYMMIMLCTPALLFCSLLTFPALLFQSPEQQAYYEFAKSLDQDPSRWVILAVAGLCALIALAIPATAPQPQRAVRS